MKKTYFLILTALLLTGNMAKAQFNKPLQSSRSKFYSTQAKYNVGLIGGATMTQWRHIGGTKTDYDHPFNFGLVGGIAIEKMLQNNLSLSVEGLYAMRTTELSYLVLNLPISLTESKDFYRQLNADYQEVDIQVPFTYYMGQGNIRPYAFVAPRVSIPLSGKMIWQTNEIENYGTEDQQNINPTTDTLEMTAQNMRPWNVGAVAGLGVLFKINFSNYYFLVKADASYHTTVVNSFSQEEASGESQNVIGASYIDPYLMSYRFNTDVTAKVTLLFPLKKQLKGACMRWGEYD